jgi:3-oxoacyl-[acyl-carrier-protein] synthase II
MGDYAELDAINRLGLQEVPITANKSQLGHCMGAAGSVELAMSIMSLKHAIIPPTVNVEEVEEGYSPKIYNKSTSAEITSVLCNSFGFGGTNASILVS